uniref:hypothetical protein n=1 Tax=Jatropha curcas TaxID=180498 RepID=UPI0027A52F5A|nr:hypothetical protein QLP06_mgp039 [Jatropha curcas]WFG81200.1 hypothetical protein [Jatropha curcas]
MAFTARSVSLASWMYDSIYYGDIFLGDSSVFTALAVEQSLIRGSGMEKTESTTIHLNPISILAKGSRRLLCFLSYQSCFFFLAARCLNRRGKGRGERYRDTALDAHEGMN